MTKVDSDTGKKIQELQALEQNLQSLLMQKQSIQIELNEINNALAELKNYKGEAYKILSGIMIKESSEKIKTELEEKKKNISLHLTSIDKQETVFSQKADELRKEVSEILRR